MSDGKRIERCDWRTFLTASDDTPADVVAALDQHFKHYAQPEFEQVAGEKTCRPAVCAGCGENLTGSALDGLFGNATFEWGIVHGEGRCGRCGWPATGHHFIRGTDGNAVATLNNFVMSYHPDFVERRDTPKDAEKVEP